MPELLSRLLAPAGGTPSPQAGLFLWQLDDQSHRLAEDTRGATPEELAWQPAPGMNTMGMLLAHVAAVEVGWIEVGFLGQPWRNGKEREVLGLAWEDIGIPLEADASAPPQLAGRPLDYFDDLLRRARAHTRHALASVADADLERRFRMDFPDGVELEGNAGWVLYHVLEHQAGHYGQINLLRHQYQARKT